MPYHASRFDWRKMATKGAKYFVIFGLSAAATQFLKSPLAGITLGSLVVMVLNWLKVYWGVKIP